MRHYSHAEVADRFARWLDAYAEQHPATVEAEFHVGMTEDQKRAWRAEHGDAVPIEVTTERFHRFLAENPGVLLGWLV